MKPLPFTVNELALELHVPASRIAEIAHGRCRVTVETATSFWPTIPSKC